MASDLGIDLTIREGVGALEIIARELEVSMQQRFCPKHPSGPLEGAGAMLALLRDAHCKQLFVAGATVHFGGRDHIVTEAPQPFLD